MLSPPPPPPTHTHTHTHTLLLTNSIKLYGIPTKIKWKMDCIDTLYLKFWRYFLWKFIIYSHQPFYLTPCFTLPFKSTDIIFENFLKLYSILSEKRFSSQFLLMLSLKSKSPYFLLNKNINFSKNKGESKMEDPTQTFEEVMNLVLQLI